MLNYIIVLPKFMLTVSKRAFVTERAGALVLVMAAQDCFILLRGGFVVRSEVVSPVAIALVVLPKTSHLLLIASVVHRLWELLDCKSNE
jgi:hypothetical protein